MTLSEGNPPDDWLPAVAQEMRESESVRYRALALALRHAIGTGRISVGAQLPPQRELALRLGVGRTTVVEACNLLRAESIIRSRQGAGTWVIRR